MLTSSGEFKTGITYNGKGHILPGTTKNWGNTSPSVEAIFDHYKAEFGILEAKKEERAHHDYDTLGPTLPREASLCMMKARFTLATVPAEDDAPPRMLT
ncbi:hypothetical protein ACJ41O_008929 [Fusarium nematophilum]